MNKRSIILVLISISTFIFFSPTLFANTNFDYPQSCLAQLIDEKVKIDYIIDGDTLKLTDGRTIRVIGVNTPELNKRTNKPEPYAITAKQAAEKFFDSQKIILIQYGELKYDRHERLLAYVFREDKQNLSAYLLANGFGFQIAIPPNLAYLDCFSNAQQHAKLRKLGVWSDNYFAYKKVKSAKRHLKSGFQLLEGKVVKVKKTKRNWWLELDGPVVLKISHRNAKYFPDPNLKSLKNQQIKAKGWLVKRHSKAKNPRAKPWILTIHHPTALEYN